MCSSDLSLGLFPRSDAPDDGVTGAEQVSVKAGATLTSTETVLFDLLGVAGTPEFKELAPLIR